MFSSSFVRVLLVARPQLVQNSSGARPRVSGRTADHSRTVCGPFTSETRAKPERKQGRAPFSRENGFTYAGGFLYGVCIPVFFAVELPLCGPAFPPPVGPFLLGMFPGVPAVSAPAGRRNPLFPALFEKLSANGIASYGPSVKILCAGAWK